MGVLKVVLPALGAIQILLAFLYADAAFQAKVCTALELALFNRIVL